MFQSQSSPRPGTDWRTTQATSSGGSPRDLDVRSDQRINIPPKKASIHSLHSFDRKGDQVTGDRSSIGRRIRRTLLRFFIAVLVGVGATLAWQSYGDAARETVIARAPTLAWLLSISVTKSSVVAEVQQLELLATNLYVVRRSLEQLAAKQEEISQNIATLQALDEDIRQKMASAPPSSSQSTSIAQQNSPKPKMQSSLAQSSSMNRVPPPTAPLVPSR